MLLPLKPFYFLRHGETDWNKKELIMGSKDIPLNEKGVKQAYEAADILKEEEFKLIIASSKSRALKTAEIVAKHTGRTLIINENLVEKGWGEAEGEPFNVIKSLTDAQIEPKGAEPSKAFEKRVLTTIATLLQQNHLPLLVSHGGVFKVLVAHLGHDYIRPLNCQPFYFKPPENPSHPWLICPLEGDLY